MPLTSLLLPRSNIDTPLAGAVFAVSLVFMITSLVSVVLRLWAKQINKSKIIIEDYLCIISLLLVVGQFICLCIMIRLGGVGHDISTLDAADMAWTFKVLIGFQSLYCLAVASVKSSLCFFYIRIFAVSRTYRIAAYCVIAFIAAWAVLSVLIAFVSCIPFAFTWDQSIVGGSCDNEVGSFVAEAVLDLAADIMVFILPIRPIWQLQVNNQKRFVLFMIFGLGVSTMIMAILRVVGLYELNFATFQISAVPPLIYSVLEPAIGISVASSPLLQPLIKDTWLGKKLAKSGTKHSQPAYRKRNNSNPTKGYTRKENEFSLVGPADTSISGGMNSQVDNEDLDAFRYGDSTTGIIKTDHIMVSREV